MKMQTGAWLAGLCMLGAAGPAAAQQETFRCHQADGRIVFQQTPCALTELAPSEPAPMPATAPAPEPLQATPAAPTAPRISMPAEPERPTRVPATAAVAPAPVPARNAAPKADEPDFVRPTRRKREILELSAQLERCRVDVPGFAQKSAAVYTAWRRRHAPVLSEYDKLLAAKVRAGRRGDSSLPIHLCTDEWLADLEPLSRMPDARFATVEKTWQVFMGALMTGDRDTALDCLAGRANNHWKERVENMSDEDLRGIAASIRALKVQWGDDYAKEGLIADTANRVVGVAFQNVNEEWKISDWGGPAALPTPRSEREDLPRVHDVLRVERALDGAHHVHRAGAGFVDQEAHLVQAHAVLAGAGAAQA
jgi:hypothetical protein